MTKARRCAGALTAAIILSLGSVTHGQTVTMPDGNRLTVFDTSSGVIHEFDSRSTLEKWHEKLPDRLQKLTPMKINGGQISISGDDSLAVAFRLPASARAGWGYEVYLSSTDGWYSVNRMEGTFQNAIAALFPMAPREPESLTLSFYDRGVSHAAPRSPIANMAIRSPRHDPAVSSLKSTPLPATLSAGPYQVKSKGLYTSLYLGDLNDRFCYYAPDCPKPVSDLIAGKVQRAAMPQDPMSAYVFEVEKADETPPHFHVGQLMVQDSKGSSYATFTSCYQSSGTMAATWHQNMPTHDGDYRYTFSLYEDPPSTAPAWVSQHLPLKSSPADKSTTQILGLGKFSVQASVSSSQSEITLQRISFHDEDDLRRLVIQVLDEQTSNPVPFSSQIDYPLNGSQYALLNLATPLTTAGATLRLAPAIEHKLTFKATPVRP